MRDVKTQPLTKKVLNMTYQVKELFYSLQGEGVHTGRGAVFCRFSGCNLWSGRETDRAQATCDFCDTDFVGGEKYSDAKCLAQVILDLWPAGQDHKFVILTGGEPGLQIDNALILALHDHGFEIAIETNGTQNLPQGIDWLTVSPKANEALSTVRGDELKLVFPQPLNTPQDFEHLDFKYFYLQPKDGPDQDQNIALAMAYTRAHPRWRLSLQTHKLLNIR